MKLSLSDALLASFPELSVHGLLARDCPVAALADFSLAAALPELDPLAAQAAVEGWQAVYRQFPADRRARSSIAYLTSAAAYGKLHPISPLVDLYNVASLLSLAPFGGEDVDTLGGALQLTLARGDESFVPLGRDAAECPLAGEVVWLDAAGRVVCRAMNWLESDRHKLTDATRHAVFISERAHLGLPSPQPGIDYLLFQLAEAGVGSVQPFRLDAGMPGVTLS
jgi:DNA/RNA-binding domain of Phe-tRNA-synthetase-like protein